jgi:hypothetical protein
VALIAPARRGRQHRHGLEAASECVVTVVHRRASTIQGPQPPQFKALIAPARTGRQHRLHTDKHAMSRVQDFFLAGGCVPHRRAAEIRHSSGRLQYPVAEPLGNDSDHWATTGECVVTVVQRRASSLQPHCPSQLIGSEEARALRDCGGPGGCSESLRDCGSPTARFWRAWGLQRRASTVAQRSSLHRDSGGPGRASTVADLGLTIRERDE